MSESLFYNLGEIEEIAVNLFYGWGYNFYRAENQVRADDLLVRQKVSWLLGQAREVVQTQLAVYRRTFLPLPTREKPLPDPDALAAAGTLERLSADIGQLESTIRGLPVPETDRMTQRFRDELSTLVTLREQDSRLDAGKHAAAAGRNCRHHPGHPGPTSRPATLAVPRGPGEACPPLCGIEGVQH